MAADRAVVGEAAHAARDAGDSRTGLSVLLIDDFDDGARRIGDHVRSIAARGVQITHTDDTDNALSLCRERRFDLAIVDIWVGQKTTAAIVDDIHGACDKGIVLLTTLPAEAIAPAIGDLNGIVILSKRDIDGDAAPEALVQAMA